MLAETYKNIDPKASIPPRKIVRNCNSDSLRGSIRLSQMEIHLSTIKNKQRIQWSSAYVHAWRWSTWMLSLTQVFQSQKNIIVLLIPLDAAGLKIDWSVPRSMERSVAPEVPHCRLSQMCSSNQPAGLQDGHQGMNCWESDCAQHCTSLWLQEYLELADWTQYCPQQVSFSLRHFSSLLPAISGGKASQQIFARVTAWKLLITNAEKNREETYTARTWAYQTP